MIEESEHFVYIENQFFITSCETMNVKIINKIGDAIVERAVRAYKNNESWRCIILIPLMPGFQNTVDAPDGTSVRLIMQCQFRSISRGEGSIFERLRSEGIEPEDFVTFYSLRAWGKIGPRKMLVTEQLYIHAKAIIVDDRIALIGSANINERSMLGFRDSECAAVVRDTDMIWSTMDGEPYLVGRFAHTLRMRLMREHLGLDVDEVMEEERRVELDREDAEYQSKMNNVYGNDDSDVDVGPSVPDAARVSRQHQIQDELLVRQERMRSFNHDVEWEQGDNPNVHSNNPRVISDKRVTDNPKHGAKVDGEGNDHWKAAEKSSMARGRDSVLVGDRDILVTDIASEGKGTLKNPGKAYTSPSGYLHDEERSSLGNTNLPPLPILPRRTTDQLGLPQLSQLPALPVLDDTDIGGPPVKKGAGGKAVESNNPLLADIKRPMINKDCMRDPLNDSFFEDIWRLVAENNTKIFRRVFRCNPDNEVSNWHEYREFQAYAERFAQAQAGTKSQPLEEQESAGKSGPPGACSAVPEPCVVGQGSTNVSENLAAHARSGNSQHPLGIVSESAQKAQAENKAGKTTNGINDKVSTRDSNEMLSPVPSIGDTPFPPLETSSSPNQTTLKSGKASEKPSAHRATFTAQAEKTGSNATVNTPLNQGSVKRRRRATTKSRKGFSASDDLLSYEDAEQLLSMVQGSLVLFPHDWLKAEEHNSNWLYQVDRWHHCKYSKLD
jgi:phospholipase D1/2